jgi:hypothetical protein
MIERAKTQEVTKTFLVWPSRILGILISMPLSVKLGLLVLITLVTRILALCQTRVISTDGVVYIQTAKLFSEGRYAEIGRFDLYPVILFLVHGITGDWELSGLLISITLGTLTVVPVFLLGRSLYNEKMGWLSALFYITLPDFLKYDSDVLRDPTSWFFMATTLYLVWEGLKKNRLGLIGLASISAGLGTLIRVEGFIVWGVLAILAAFRKVPRVSPRRRALNVTVLVLLFPFLLLPVLWSVKKHSNQIAFGEMISFPLKFITVNASLILQPENLISMMGPKVYESLHYVPRGAVDLASRYRVVLAISEVLYKLIKSANLLFVLILLGLWKRKREGFESPDWYLLYIFAALFCVSVLYARQIYYFSTRHGLTLVLPCLFFAGHGLDVIAGTLLHRLNAFPSKWIVMKKYLPHIVTILLVIIFLAQGLSARRTGKIHLKEVGVWLKENGYQGSVIMGPQKFLRVVFYAEGKFVEIPDSWGKGLDIIRENGVKVVVIDPCTIEQECPDFLKNLVGSKLFPIQGPKGGGDKCPIQIYGVY